MGSAAVIFVLLVVIAGMAIGWRSDHRATKILVESHRLAIGALTGELKRNAQLEAEIQRLRKIPLTQEPEKVDNSVIKARSAAQVRQLTETAFGLQPEIGEQNDNE